MKKEEKEEKARGKTSMGKQRKRHWTKDDTELTLLGLPTAIWFILFSYLPMFGLLIAFKKYKISTGHDDTTHKVVSTLETDEIMDELKTLHQWYKSGIINSDAATLAETPAYRTCFTAQGWSGAAKTTWGPQMGVDADAVQWGDTIMSNDTVRGSLNCISSSCKNPDKALELLQLVNTDSYVRDSLYYGLEGDNWDYTSDKKVHKNNTDWTMAGIHRVLSLM